MSHDLKNLDRHVARDQSSTFNGCGVELFAVSRGGGRVWARLGTITSQPWHADSQIPLVSRLYSETRMRIRGRELQ